MGKAVLYINGLGDGTTQEYEAMAFKKMRHLGFNVVHAHVQWRKEQDFSKLLEELVLQARELVENDNELTIIGLSAGGSMALNLYAKLNNKNIKIISIIGRLRKGFVLPWSYRTMKRAAHFGTRHESKIFYDSVMHCEDSTIPSLAIVDRQNIITLKPITDLIVPLNTMSIAGVKNIRIPALGHVMACSVGLNKAADFLKK